MTLEIRPIDEERRVFRAPVGHHWKYHDACIMADTARAATGAHFVVWDTDEKRAIYDSRKLAR